MLNLEWLKEIEVIKHDFAYEIMAESTRDSLFCHHCFKFDVIGHGIKKQLVNDTPMHGKKVVIRVLRKRFRCKDCGKTFMEELPDIDDKRLATKRLVEWVSKRAIDHTFTSVAHDTGLNEKTVRNIFEDYAAGLNKQFKVVTPRWLGIDEVHLNKKMRCVVTNIEHNTIVEMFEFRTQDKVIKALYDMKDRDKVELVTMDMWRPYARVAKEMFPNATIVIDKFHVVRLAGDGMESARKAIRTELTAEGRKAMLGDRFVMLRYSKELSPEDHFKLSGIISNYPLLEKAYIAKESYYGIWDAGEKQKAEDLYECWRDGIEDEIKPHFKKLTSAMKNWRKQIFNYFDHPITNAYTESVNGIIKIVNRNGRGYSFSALRTKILFAEKAHKRESKSIRSLLSERGDKKHLGFMTDESLNYGVHMPTLIKMEEDGEF
jgi:transposase